MKTLLVLFIILTLGSFGYLAGDACTRTEARLREENARLHKLVNDQDATIQKQDEALKGAMSAMENMQDAMETQGEALKRATAAMDDSTVTLRKANSTLSTCRAIVEGRQ